MVNTYEALKDLNVFLITTGRKDVDIPAKHFDLSYSEYLKLLTASSLVVTMSQFKEGWCRTTHEAMLCKTPVIGSGAGGMKELLEGGGQIICDDFSVLKEKVREILMDKNYRNQLGEKGYDYAKNFTIDKFNQEWISVIKDILSK